jgi:hypothetical protein
MSTLNSRDFSAEATKNYKLQSIVHHIGSRASSGHYTADAVRTVTDTWDDDNNEILTPCVGKGADKIWVSFDDSNTCETSIETILENPFKQSTAYMLLYNREE